MIELVNVSKDYPTKAGPRRVLNNINLTIRPGEKVGILGQNGAGKSTLIRLISGAELPTVGRINRNMSVSWPLAFSGGFQGSLTGAMKSLGADTQRIPPSIRIKVRQLSALASLPCSG